MKKFIVSASYSTRSRVEVFAADADEALQISSVGPPALLSQKMQLVIHIGSQ